MRKRFLAAVLMLVLAAAPLAGCTGSGSTAQNETARATEATNPNSNETGENTMETTNTTEQISKTPATFEPPGVELLKNADFADGLKHWRQYAKCKTELVTDPQSGKNAVLVTEMSANWAVVCQDLTKTLAEYGRGTYYFGANVKTDGGAARIMVIVHYRDAAGRNWTHSGYADIDGRGFTYIDASAIIDWSGEKATEVDLYLSTETSFSGGLLIDYMTFRYVSDRTTIEGLQRPDIALRNGRALVGAIRWDAWIGNGEGGVGQVVSRSLSPEKYHFRLPWFSTVLGPDEVFIDGATQEIVDDEIQFAKSYGIDYFAVLHYDDGMSFARKAYQNSLYRNGMKWCALLESHRFSVGYGGLDGYIEEFQKPYYLKTADGRPVIYIFQAEPWIKEGLDEFRRKCEGAGVAEPYIIAMNFDIPKAAMLCAELGLQGISLYTGAIPSSGCSYSEVMENDRAKWQGMKKTGAQFVPQVTSGWDKRPRYDHPNPWEPDYEDFKNQYSEQGTPEQIAQNIENAFAFNDENREQTVFNSVLVYAWNENDEGGWIMPTYFELRDHKKPLRLDAIREMLKKHRAAYADIGTYGADVREAIQNLAVAGVFCDIPGDSFEPQKEVSAAEFAGYFIRSVGYLVEYNPESGGGPITYGEAAQIAIDIVEAAGDSRFVIPAGDEKLTRAGAALLIYQLTQMIFDLPTGIAE